MDGGNDVIIMVLSAPSEYFLRQSASNFYAGREGLKSRPEHRSPGSGSSYFSIVPSNRVRERASQIEKDSFLARPC